MADIGATFGLLGQGQAALSLTGAARGFDLKPGVLSGLRLVDTVSGIIGVERISGQLEPCPGGLNRLGLAIWLACDSLDGLVMEERHAFSPVGRSARACDRRD